MGENVQTVEDMASSRLFAPVTVGNMKLKQRIGMCPLTRYRAADNHDPMPIMVEYYVQRASTPGTLIITEGTFITDSQAGYRCVPGIYTPAHVAGWKKVTDAVHAKGCFIFCQLWALGRASMPDVLAEKGFQVTGASAVASRQGAPVPLPLTLEQIQQTVQGYAQAARNAVEAGFDGVELHSANGYLLDQFIQDVSNKRDDDYGGSVEKRSRFAVEVVQAVVDAVGAKKVGIRFSPFSPFGGMGMEDPIPQFSDVIKKISVHHLAYIHLTEPRVAGNLDRDSKETLSFAYDLWKGTLLIAGGYMPALAKKLVDEDRPDRDIVVMFGRHFIANPDLPFRIKYGLELNPYNRSTFYVAHSEEGYTTYPFSKEYLERVKV